MTIKPVEPEPIRAFLEAYDTTTEPTLYEFPSVLRQNLAFIDDLPVNVYVAHKATKCKAMIQTAQEEGVGIDVSSSGELDNARQTSTSIPRLEATGPKNTAFIDEIRGGDVLVSVDSIAELYRIAEAPRSTDVLLRVADPLKDIDKATKFGICRNRIEEAQSVIKESNVVMRGFHYHGDGLTSRLRAKVVSSFLELIENKFPHANCINVGGGFQAPLLANPTTWSKHIQTTIQGLRDGYNLAWGTAPYGLHVTRNGSIQGRENAMLPAHDTTLRTQLTSFLDETVRPHTTVADIIHDTDIEVIIEPGHSLLYNTGVASLPVEHVKHTPSGPLTVVNAHTFMLSTNMSAPKATPRLLPEKDGDTFNTFIGGLLCRNDDVFTTRKVELHRRPRSGDNLVFFNQGSYATYEEGHPQLHPTITTEVVYES